MEEHRFATNPHTIETHLTRSDLIAELQTRALPISGSNFERAARIALHNQNLLDSNELQNFRLNHPTVAEPSHTNADKDEDVLSQLDLSQSSLFNTSNPQPLIPPNPPQMGTTNTSNTGAPLDMTQMFAQLMFTQQQQQQQLLQLLAQRNVNPQPTVVTVQSTSDTVNSIPNFSGNIQDNAQRWIREINRIANHANWSASLTLLNAATRLIGKAKDWHDVYGRDIPTWTAWSQALIKRFSERMNMPEFVAYNATRTLRSNETITDYIFAKNAMLENAPFKIVEEERVQLIISDIPETNWAASLASTCCVTVDELLNKAAKLDKLRKPLVSTAMPDSTLQSSSHQTSIVTTPRFNSSPKFNPHTDDPKNFVCYRCGHQGHVSFNCTRPAPTNKLALTSSQHSGTGMQPPQQNVKTRQYTAQPNPQRQLTPENRPTPQASTQGLSQASHPGQNRNSNANVRSNNLITPTFIPTLRLVPATIAGHLTIDCLLDNGAVFSLMRRCLAPADAIIHPWQDDAFEVPGSQCTPVGWISLRIQVGKTDYVMPRVALCDKLPVALLLGLDWQFAVHAQIFTDNEKGILVLTTPSTSDEFLTIRDDPSFVGCLKSPRPNRDTHPQLDDHLNFIDTDHDITPIIQKNQINAIKEDIYDTAPIVPDHHITSTATVARAVNIAHGHFRDLEDQHPEHEAQHPDHEAHHHDPQHRDHHDPQHRDHHDPQHRDHHDPQHRDSFCKRISKNLANDAAIPHHKLSQATSRVDVQIRTARAHVASRIVIPQTHQSIVFRFCHDDAALFDTPKPLDRLRFRYWREKIFPIPIT